MNPACCGGAAYGRGGPEGRFGGAGFCRRRSSIRRRRRSTGSSSALLSGAGFSSGNSVSLGCANGGGGGDFGASGGGLRCVGAPNVLMRPGCGSTSAGVMGSGGEESAVVAAGLGTLDGTAGADDGAAPVARLALRVFRVARSWRAFSLSEGRLSASMYTRCR